MNGYQIIDFGTLSKIANHKYRGSVNVEKIEKPLYVKYSLTDNDAFGWEENIVSMPVCKYFNDGEVTYIGRATAESTIDYGVSFQLMNGVAEIYVDIDS